MNNTGYWMENILQISGKHKPVANKGKNSCFTISKLVALITADSSTVELKESSTVALTVVVFLNCNVDVVADPAPVLPGLFSHMEFWFSRGGITAIFCCSTDDAPLFSAGAEECKWGKRAFSKSSIWLACKLFNWFKKLGSKVSKICGLLEMVFSGPPEHEAGLAIGWNGKELKDANVALEPERLGRSSSSIGGGSGRIRLVWKRLVECCNHCLREKRLFDKDIRQKTAYFYKFS